MEKRTAVLVGASGLVGRFCLSYLLMNKKYERVIVLVRKELPIKDPKLEQQVINFDQIDSCKDRIKGDDIFCCLGTTIRTAKSKANFRKVDFEYPAAIAKTALENGAQQFMIVSALGANKNASIFYNRVKGEMEEELKRLPFKSIHIFQPSILTGLRTEFRLGERIGIKLMQFFSFLFIGSWKKFRPIDAMVVAFTMVYNATQNSSGIFVHTSDKIQETFDQNKRL